MENFRFDSYSSLLFDSILPSLIGVVFERKIQIHSTSEFAMTVLSEQVCDSCWIRQGGMNPSGNGFSKQNVDATARRLNLHF